MTLAYWFWYQIAVCFFIPVKLKMAIRVCLDPVVLILESSPYCGTMHKEVEE